MLGDELLQRHVRLSGAHTAILFRKRREVIFVIHCVLRVLLSPRRFLPSIRVLVPVLPGTFPRQSGRKEVIDQILEVGVVIEPRVVDKLSTGLDPDIISGWSDVSDLS